MILTAFTIALGFFAIGTQHQPLLVFVAYVFTACMWTPMVPLTDAYALRGRGAVRPRLRPAPAVGLGRLCAGALVCGLLVDFIAARHLIWVIAAMGGLGALASLRSSRSKIRERFRQPGNEQAGACCVIPDSLR